MYFIYVDESIDHGCADMFLDMPRCEYKATVVFDKAGFKMHTPKEVYEFIRKYPTEFVSLDTYEAAVKVIRASDGKCVLTKEYEFGKFWDF